MIILKEMHVKPVKPRIFLCFRKKDERQTRERLHHGLDVAVVAVMQRGDEDLHRL